MKSYIKKNKYDVYNKIIKVINSCKTVQQVASARKMINNFNILYDDKLLYGRLRDVINNRFYKVI